MQRKMRAGLAAILAVSLAAMTGCPGGVPSKPAIPGRASGVDPNTCGNYAASDAGRKLKAFFEAVVRLDAAVKDTENYVRDSCGAMGKELGMAEADLKGDTKDTCNKVFAELKNHLSLGIKADAKLNIDYTPAVCTVNIDAAASASAKCEGKAKADISVRCTGKCGGTCSGSCSGQCNGSCSGTCQGSSGEGGECNGVCEGTCEGSCDATCEGSCSGGCEGSADVEASAECKAQAEVYASVDAKCTEPELEITWDAGVVIDESKLTAAVAAIKAGLPRFLMLHAKLTGPIKAAATTTLKTGGELVAAGNKLAKSFDDQAMCVLGQIKSAFDLIGSIGVSIDVQVEVSASASGSVGT